MTELIVIISGIFTIYIILYLYMKLNNKVDIETLLNYYPNFKKFDEIRRHHPRNEYFYIWETACLYYFMVNNLILLDYKTINKYNSILNNVEHLKKYDKRKADLYCQVISAATGSINMNIEYV